MILLTHVIIALASVGYSTYLFFNPAPAKFRAAYYLVGLTLASGTYLVASSGTHLLQACLSGLVYIGAVAAMLARAKNKLAKQDSDI